MSINYETVRNAVRKRVISSTRIDALTQFFPQNVECNPAGLSLFIREYSLGGTAIMASPKRSRIPSFLIQYDFYVPINRGMATLETALNNLASEFDLASDTKSNVTASGLNIIIKSITRDGEDTKEYHREKVLFTLDVTEAR